MKFQPLHKKPLGGENSPGLDRVNSRSDWLMIEGDCCICQSERSFFDVCHIILFPSPGSFDWLADNSFVLMVTEVGYGSWWFR